MKGIVKEKVKVRNHTFTIYFHIEFGFITQSEEDQKITEAFTVFQKDAPQSVPFFMEIGSFKNVPFKFRQPFDFYPTIETYWDDMFVGIKEFYGELFDLFPMPLVGFQIELSKVGGNYRSIIDWFNSLHPHVQVIEVQGDDIDFRRYLYAIKNLKPTDRLTMDARPTRYHETGSIEFSVDELRIEYAPWIFPSHIREMSSTEIYIWYTNFTDEEINELLCSLKAGSNPQLKKMNFSIWRRANPKTFLKNLNAIELDYYSWSFVLAGRRRCEVTYRKKHSEPDLRIFSLTIEKLPRLPLLKLPDLAFVNVLETMKLVNLFMFATLSKRMKKIVKDNVKIRNHTINILMEKSFGIEFRSTKNKEPYEVFAMDSVDKSAPYCRNFFEYIGESSQVPFRLLLQEETHGIWTFWTDKFIGIKEMYKEISNLFSIPLTHIHMNLDIIGDKLQSIISWINELNPRVPAMYVGGDNCDFQQITSTIEQVFTGKLDIYAVPKEYLEPEQLHTNVDQIIIQLGQWVKVKHLQSLSSSRIKITKSYLLDQEINEFLRLLKSGSNPNLKMCVLQFMQDADRTTVLEGLDAIGADREWKFQLENGEWCTVSYFRLHRLHPNLREILIDIERKEDTVNPVIEAQPVL
ncbi:unnamed protein product [Caenorhabditis brenneri]